MTIKRRLRGYYATAVELDHDHFDRVFTLFLLLVIGTMLALTPGYRDDSQLFPLVIGVPTFVLLGFLLAVQLSPRLRTIVSGYASSDLFDLDEVVSDIDDTPGVGGMVRRTLAEERRAVLIISIWTLGLFGIVYLVGFLPGTLIFMLAFYRIQADQPWIKVVLYSLVMWAFVLVIFEIVLNTPFYTGVFDVELPLPF